MESDFKEYPKRLARDDFWGQVKRTVNGKPVTEDQIQMIVQAITTALELSKTDVLLDLGCGNGALSERVFGRIAAFHGVDYSDCLISVAKERFEQAPAFCFEIADVADYVDAEAGPDRFTKALCYGCFSYFDEHKAARVLATLGSRFVRIDRVLLGNLPDRERAHLFYREGVPDARELTDPDSKIGIWRTRAEFTELARSTGWNCSFLQMPDAFYAAHYRYDVLLERVAK